MVQPKIVLGMERRSDPDLLACGGAVLAALKEHAAFPAPWGEDTPSWEQLDAGYQAYRDAYNAALGHDTQKILLRHEARRAFVERLRRLAAYLELKANGNVAMLASTGFELRQDQARAGPGHASLPGPVAGLRSGATAHRGRIELRANRATGALAYELQTATRDPSSAQADASLWTHAHTIFLVQSFKIDGLPQGFVWVRMRGLNNRGPGPWSEPLRVLVA